MTGNELIKINLLPAGSPLPRAKSGFGLVSCLALLLLLAVLAYAGWLGYQEFSRVSTGDDVEDANGTIVSEPAAAGTDAAPAAQAEQSATIAMATQGGSDATPADSQPQDTTADPWAGARQPAAKEQNTNDESATAEPIVQPAAPAQPDAPATPQAAPILPDRFQPLAEELAQCLEEMRLAMDVGNYPAAAAIGIKVLEALTEVGEMPAILQQFVDEIVWLRGMALQLQEREDDKRQNVAFENLPIRLDGVIWSPDKSLAFVNGTTLAVGDPVPGLEVVPPPLVEEIRRDRVRFHYRGNTFEKKVELFGE